MNKILKIIISILIAISIAVNPFAVTVHAVDPATIAFIIAQFVKWAAEGFVVGLGTYVTAQAAQSMHDAEQVAITQAEWAAEAASRGPGYQISAEEVLGHEGQFILKASPSSDYATLSSDEKEFADFLINYINSSTGPYFGDYNFTLDPTVPNITFSAESYEDLKTDVSNAYNEWAIKKVAEESKNDFLLSVVESGQCPVYSFDFVGPLPHLTVPSTEGLVDLSHDGFIFTPPLAMVQHSGGLFYYDSEAAALSAGVISPMLVEKRGDTEYWTGGRPTTSHGGGSYIIYNGVMYYRVQHTYFPEHQTATYYLSGVGQTGFSLYTSAEGVLLSSVYVGGAIHAGYFYNLTGEIESADPCLTSVSEDDFLAVSEGGTAELDRSDEEETIGKAIGLGLVNDDSVLSFAEDGTIAAADGIEIAKMNELIEKIQSGTLELEDIQSYLELITKMISSGNMTATDQALLLERLATLSEAQAKDITEINAALQAIAAATAVDDTIEDVDTDLSYLKVTHHGLTEAQNIVNTALPVVAQSQQLVTNLFDSTSSSTEIPNFSFYMDINKDGVQEKYILFDLSFMEQTLSNENLDDKSLFQKPMTIREFIQALILLITYATFCIKFLRKLPGLFSSSESFADKVDTRGG